MVKINMMCGKRNFGSDWINVDGFIREHINETDIHLSKMPEKSVDLIYCSHGIAYFNDGGFLELLLSWKRVLKPKGVLRISTPDWDVLRLFKYPMKGPIYGQMLLNGDFIYHKNVYCFITLSSLLRSAGFLNVRRYDHTKTEHPNTGDRNDKYDDHSAAYYDGHLISLNVECNA